MHAEVEPKNLPRRRLVWLIFAQKRAAWRRGSGVCRLRHNLWDPVGTQLVPARSLIDELDGGAAMMSTTTTIINPISLSYATRKSI